MLRAGIDGGEKAAGTIVHSDHDTVFCNANLKGVQVMPVSYAQFKYGLEEYSWKLIEKDRDIFTERTAGAKEGGYFIRAEKGAKARRPNIPSRPAHTSKRTRSRRASTTSSSPRKAPS